MHKEEAQGAVTIWFQVLTSRVTEPTLSITLNGTHTHTRATRPVLPPLRAQGRQTLWALVPEAGGTWLLC